LLFSLLGFDFRDNYWNWLRKSIGDKNWKPIINNCIAFCIGSSNILKRLDHIFWGNLIENVVKNNSFNSTLIIIAGKSDNEINDALLVVNNLRKRNIKIELVMNQSLYRLSEIIAGLSLLISPDSYLVHFAEGLGTKVLGIYTSTNPLIYGPQYQGSKFVVSDYYFTCPWINEYGNCLGWDGGCDNPKCKEFVTPMHVIINIKEIIGSK